MKAKHAPVKYVQYPILLEAYDLFNVRRKTQHGHTDMGIGDSAFWEATNYNHLWAGVATLETRVILCASCCQHIPRHTYNIERLADFKQEAFV